MERGHRQISGVAAALSGARLWLALVAASLGMLLSSLDIAVNVALPDITAGFSADQLTIQWIILLYMGGSTSLQLGLGAAADLYGLRRLYIFGLAAYGLATFLIGLAPTLPLVFALRLFQAVGNALIMASAPALVTAIFPAERRGGALGVMAGIATLGMISAALGGGALVDAFGWRAIFLARAPIVLIAIALAFALLPGIGAAPDARERRFDLRGAALAFICLSALALSLTLGGRIGWLSPLVVALAAIALATLALLLRWERLAAHPVLDPALLRHPLLAPVLAASFLMFMAQFVNLFILPFYVSDVLRVNAKSLGFLLMLSPALAAVAAPVGGWLSDRMPAAYITTIALSVSAAALLWFSALTAASGVPDVALRMALVGIGTGLFQASSATLIMGAMPARRLGSGGALVAISRSLGTVTSVALMSALFAARQDFHAAAHGETQAFVRAFSDTYLIAAALGALAAALSLSYWPRALAWRNRRRAQ